MRVDTGFGPLSRSPLQLDGMFSRTWRLVRDRVAKMGGAADLRLRPLIEEMVDISARTTAYVLAMLGLLYTLGVAATAP